MDIASVSDLDISGKRVFVRADVDFEFNEIENNPRLDTAVNIIKHIVEKGARKIIVAGHKGRPSSRLRNGEPSDSDANQREELSLKGLVPVLSEKLGQEIGFTESVSVVQSTDTRIVLLNNLRLDPREEQNSEELARELAELADDYVNEAFASSHREHCSVVALPKVVKAKGGKAVLGLRFAKEIEVLERIRDNPERPLVAIISGIKEDKLKYAKEFEKFSDKILIGGRLPEYLPESEKDKPVSMQSGKSIIGKLLPDKEDITLRSIERFEQEIRTVGTIILAGAIGKYEDEGHRQGTKRIFEAVANSGAYKLAGGGDTEAAITMFGLNDKFDWISVGGGACLEFLATGTLFGIEALEIDR